MVSKYPLNQQVENKAKEIFLETLVKLKTKEEVNSFIEEFFTPTEKTMFVKRLAIAVLLSKGYDSRAISRILKVSVTTITYVNIWIKHHQGFLKKIVQEIIANEDQQEFWEEVGYKIEKATIPLTIGNWSAKRKVIEKQHSENLRKNPF